MIGALEKRIIDYLADTGPSIKNVIKKGIRGHYKNVYYAVDRLVEKRILKKLPDRKYALTFLGFLYKLKTDETAITQANIIRKRNDVEFSEALTIAGIDSEEHKGLELFIEYISIFESEPFYKYLRSIDIQTEFRELLPLHMFSATFYVMKKSNKEELKKIRESLIRFSKNPKRSKFIKQLKKLKFPWETNHAHGKKHEGGEN